MGRRIVCFAFVDFSKAFDYLNHDILWKKLVDAGFSGRIYNMVRAMYANNKSCVKCNGAISEFFQCNIGVRQGECISPVLFNLYINDIEQYFRDRGHEGMDFEIFRQSLLLYADDTIIMAKSPERLQLALDILHDYCNKMKLTVNTEKTKVMKIVRYRRNTEPPLICKYNDIELEEVRVFKYLGLNMANNGSTIVTLNSLVNQGLRALHSMKYYLLNARFLSPKTKLSIFDTLVKSVLLYSSPVWGFINTKKIEQIHLKFCKEILQLRISTPDVMVYGELGRFPLDIDVKL